MESGCAYVELNDALGSPDLIILPGTKSTIANLNYLMQTGLAAQVVQKVRAGTPVIGICGGYQMLGELIRDVEGVESRQAEVQGLGLLPLVTDFSHTKSTHQVRGVVGRGQGILSGASGLALERYEIHLGLTTGGDGRAPFQIHERSRIACRDTDGCYGMNGDVMGTYIHGLFHNDELRRSILES